MNFRYCKPGEQQIDQEWMEWAPGTYSLKWNSTEWDKWMTDSVWVAEEISLRTGYWRRNLNSTLLLEWINEDACLGGYKPENEYPVSWKTGYGGVLWSKWKIVDGIKYEQFNSFEWLQCPKPFFNGIRVIGLILLVFGFFLFMIIINVRKTKESQLSVLLRILTNYLQLVTTSMSMSLSYPKSLFRMFSPFQKFGGPSDAFLSFDWFITDYEIKGPFDSNAALKLFLLGLLPIILFIIVSLLWLLIYLLNEKLVTNLKRNLLVSFISIMFLLHPKLIEQSLNTFRWVRIDEEMYVARFDTDVGWYSTTHLHYLIFLAAPILIIWGISMPVTALILLFKNIKSNEDNKIKRDLLILYQGLKLDRFYWEFINTLRKFLVLASLLLPNTLKIAWASAVLIVTGRFQMSLKPYKRDEFNDIEFLAVIAGIVIILSSLIYNEEEKVTYVNNFVFLATIILNIIFITKWIQLLWQLYEKKYKIAKIVRYIL